MGYPGGKGKCFQQIVNLMPPHRVYIESHLGGGAVMTRKLPAERSIGIDVDAGVIEHWRTLQLDERYQFVCSDAVSHLEQMDLRGDELIYADPPYVSSTRRKARLYRHEYTDDDHVRLLDVLTKLNCMVVLSGYDNQLYRQRLGDWRSVTFQANSQVGLREEVVWMNFAAPTALHDGRYIGKTFRERQAAKRRCASLERKISALDPLERAELLRTLTRRFSCDMTC
jgi:DNA adenine methylase